MTKRVQIKPIRQMLSLLLVLNVLLVASASGNGGNLKVKISRFLNDILDVYQDEKISIDYSGEGETETITLEKDKGKKIATITTGGSDDLDDLQATKILWGLSNVFGNDERLDALLALFGALPIDLAREQMDSLELLIEDIQDIQKEFVIRNKEKQILSQGKLEAGRVPFSSLDKAATKELGRLYFQEFPYEDDDNNNNNIEEAQHVVKWVASDSRSKKWQKARRRTLHIEAKRFPNKNGKEAGEPKPATAEQKASSYVEISKKIFFSKFREKLKKEPRIYLKDLKPRLDALAQMNLIKSSAISSDGNYVKVFLEGRSGEFIAISRTPVLEKGYVTGSEMARFEAAIKSINPESELPESLNNTFQSLPEGSRSVESEETLFEFVTSSVELYTAIDEESYATAEEEDPEKDPREKPSEEGTNETNDMNEIK